MSNNRQGGLDAAATNKSLYGEDFYRRIGALGGQCRNPNKGFGKSPEWASEAGRRGAEAKKRKKLLNN